MSLDGFRLIPASRKRKLKRSANMNDAMNIPEIIRIYRIDRGMNLSQLAQVVGVSISYLSRLERGSIKRPSYDVLRRIEEALDVQFPSSMERAVMLPHDAEMTPEEQQAVEMLIDELIAPIRAECTLYLAQLVRSYPLARCRLSSQMLAKRLLAIIKSAAGEIDPLARRPNALSDSDTMLDRIFQETRFGPSLPQESPRTTESSGPSSPSCL
jgi:transcriptional regulator with XRE-family HTH domain